MSSDITTANFALFNDVVWALTFIMTVVLSVRMFIFKMISRWRSFATLLIFSAIFYILLEASLVIPQHEKLGFFYFWTYWIGQVVLFALQYWVLWQVVKEVSGLTGSWMRAVRMGFYLISVLTLAASCCLAYAGQSSFPLRITRTVLYLDRSVALAWVLAYIAVVLCSDFVGLW